MKMKLLCVTHLALLSGLACADSAVTLYGRLDTSIAHTKLGNGESVYRVSSGAGAGGADPIAGSRWGLRGIEELGSGLKAQFVLENGISIDTGALADSNRFFNRLAWIGLASGSYGELRVGRQHTLTRELNLLSTDITSEGELTVVDSTAYGPARPLIQNFGTRVDNALTYRTPVFGGLQGVGLLSAGEGVTARQQGALVTYAQGNLKAGVAFEMYHGLVREGTYNRTFTLGATYDFGVASVSGGFQDTSDLGTATAQTFVNGKPVDHRAYNVGVMVPIQKAELRAQYTRSRLDQSGGNLDQHKYGASMRYSLSKRTQLYAVATKRGGDGSIDGTNKDREFALGLGHNF
jgi:general bacterial porin, GBP family